MKKRVRKRVRKDPTNFLRIMAPNECKIAQNSIDPIDSTRQIKVFVTAWNLNAFGEKRSDSEVIRTPDLMLRRYRLSKKTCKNPGKFAYLQNQPTNLLRIFEQPVCLTGILLNYALLFGALNSKITSKITSTKVNLSQTRSKTGFILTKLRGAIRSHLVFNQQISHGLGPRYLPLTNHYTKEGQRMARIRTVKPELCLHEGLFALEENSGLPIRIAWVGLLMAADREGRFKWQPNILKLQILPWDKLDFSKVLDALKLEGFIKQYTVDGKVYGYIPTFHIHQRVRPDEAKSQLPQEPDYSVYDELEAAQLLNTDTDSTPTVTEPDWVRYEPESAQSPIHLVEVEKEKEKEKEGKGNTAKPVFDFDRIYQEYPRKDGRQEGLKHCKTQIKSQKDYDDLLLAVRRYREQCKKDQTEKKFMKHFSTFMCAGKWRDFLDPDVGTSIAGEEESFSIARILAAKGGGNGTEAIRPADASADQEL